MKNAIYATTIAIVIASGNASADGFQPWPDPTHRNAVRTSAEVTVSESATPTSFYSAGLPQKSDRIDATQFAVEIAPFYLPRS